MITIPHDKVIEKIKQSTDLSDDDIKTKIDEKLKQLSGLISKDGAAHIIANELGVKLYEDFTGKLQIKNILSGMRNVETVGKIVTLFDIRQFKTETREGQVGSFILGDETGTVRVVCWGSMADKLRLMNVGDIIKIKEGYVKENSGNKEVHMNERADIAINPPGETVGNVSTQNNSQETKRKNIKDLGDNDNNVEILGTIVQAFDPKFYEICPECSKRVRMADEKFSCPSHGAVSPDFGYLINAFVDDGTESIRVVFFNQVTNSLLSLNKDQIIKYKDAPQSFEEVKQNIMGNQIKIVGRVQNNTMFNRTDFIANSVDISPDPDKEIERLNNELNQSEQNDG